jgi:hypothetical protein
MLNASIPVVELTQPPLQRATGIIATEVKWPERDTNYQSTSFMTYIETNIPLCIPYFW